MYEEPTTYKHDYSFPRFEYFQETAKEETIPSKKQNAHPSSSYRNITSNDTLQQLDYKTKLPFDLLWQTKDIVGTDPRTPFFKSETEEQSKNIIKLKTCISPSINLGNIKDPGLRKTVLDFTYTTTKSEAANEPWNNFRQRELVLPNVVLENSVDPVGRSSQTQNKQKSHSMQEYTVNEKIDQYETSEIRAKIQNLIENNQISLSYDKTPLSYTGYKPNLARGVPLQKKDIPIDHPDLTTTQVTYKRYGEETLNKNSSIS